MLKMLNVEDLPLRQKMKKVRIQSISCTTKYAITCICSINDSIKAVKLFLALTNTFSTCVKNIMDFTYLHQI